MKKWRGDDCRRPSLAAVLRKKRHLHSSGQPKLGWLEKGWRLLEEDPASSHRLGRKRRTWNQAQASYFINRTSWERELEGKSRDEREGWEGIGGYEHTFLTFSGGLWPGWCWYWCCGLRRPQGWSSWKHPEAFPTLWPHSQLRCWSVGLGTNASGKETFKIKNLKLPNWAQAP